MASGSDVVLQGPAMVGLIRAVAGLTQTGLDHYVIVGGASFRRVCGYKGMPKLVDVLRREVNRSVVTTEEYDQFIFEPGDLPVRAVRWFDARRWSQPLG